MNSARLPVHSFAQPRRRRPGLQLRLGLLEERCVPAAFLWVNLASGTFGDQANWRDETGITGVPGAEDDALILTPGIVVTSDGITGVRNLTSRADLHVTAGTLTATAANLLGPVDVSGGSLILNGVSTADQLALSAGGILDGAGPLRITGAMTWTGGTVAGELEVLHAAELDISGAAQKLLDAPTLTSEGTVTWDGAGGLVFRGDSAFKNLDLFRDLADHAISFDAGAGGSATFFNSGQTWKAKGSMSMGGMALEYVAIYTFATPDKMRFDLGMDAGGMKIKLSAATNGKRAWEQLGPEMREMAKEKQAEFHHTVYVMNLSQILPLKDKAYTLTSLGESKLGEQTVVGIKVARKDHRDVSMYFDKKTGLLAKTSTKTVDEATGKEQTQDVLLTGYRDKDGVKVFDKLTIRRDGKDFISEEMSEQKLLDKVDEKVFAKPTEKK